MVSPAEIQCLGFKPIGDGNPLRRKPVIIRNSRRQDIINNFIATPSKADFLERRARIYNG